MKHSKRIDINLFNENDSRFLNASTSIQNAEIGLLGVPYDGTTSFRPGTRFGPSSIRNASNSLESYCPNLDLDLNDINFTDLGSLNISNGAPEPVIKTVESATNSLLREGIKPLILGGEHSITTGAIKSFFRYYKDLILIQLDAHADLRNDWLGSKHNHACTMRRCLDILPSKQLIQVGIRSGTKEEFTELKDEGRLINYLSGTHPIELEKILNLFVNHPIYLTVDVDWFDPSIMPGTGTPEPGGFNWEDFSNIINILREYNLVGADIVELSPTYDQSQISSILAAKVARSLIMLLGKT